MDYTKTDVVNTEEPKSEKKDTKLDFNLLNKEQMYLMKCLAIYNKKYNLSKYVIIFGYELFNRVNFPSQSTREDIMIYMGICLVIAEKFIEEDRYSISIKKLKIYYEDVYTLVDIERYILTEIQWKLYELYIECFRNIV